MTENDADRKRHVGKAWEHVRVAMELTVGRHFLDAQVEFGKAADRMLCAAEVPK